jgi:hypothetical protein
MSEKLEAEGITENRKWDTQREVGKYINGMCAPSLRTSLRDRKYDTHDKCTFYTPHVLEGVEP